MVSIAGALVSCGNRAGPTIRVYSIIKQAGSNEPGAKKKKIVNCSDYVVAVCLVF